MEAHGKAYRLCLLVMWFVISLTIFVRNDWFECPDLVDKLNFATDMMRPTRWSLLHEQVEQFVDSSIGHLILLFGNIACRKKKENEMIKDKHSKLIIENENLIDNAAKIGEYFEQAFKDDKAVKEYRGKGLMIGLELNEEYVGLRNRLLFEKHFFTGAAGAGVIRLLPSLTISEETAESFVKAWKELTV